MVCDMGCVMVCEGWWWCVCDGVWGMVMVCVIVCVCVCVCVCDNDCYQIPPPVIHSYPKQRYNLKMTVLNGGWKSVDTRQTNTGFLTKSLSPFPIISYGWNEHVFPKGCTGTCHYMLGNPVFVCLVSTEKCFIISQWVLMNWLGFVSFLNENIFANPADMTDKKY